MTDKEELKFNYTTKEKALKMLEQERREKQSIANYKEVMQELNIMYFE